MYRKPITAAAIDHVDRLLAEGKDHALIAGQTGVTEYVIGVIVGDKLRVGRPQPSDRFARRSTNPIRSIDAGTIRMIQRMLGVGVLNQRQIAREAGVSAHIVQMVSTGERLTVTTERPLVFAELGELFLEEPIRCQECGAMIYITPCRACRARRN